jgi:hypothetical protein
MSGISSTGTSTAQQSNILQTNVGPITFNGVASGIDWNSVISKETALTLAPTTQYNNQIQTLSTKNQALITISSLLASVQNSLQALSDPAQYQTFLGQSSNTADATAAGIPGVSATPGVYTVTADSLATATQVTSATAKSVGKQVTSTVAIASDNFQITPVAGPSGQGQLTVDGVAIKYSPTDAVGANLNALLATIQFQVSQVDAGFTASYSVATDTVSFLSSDQPISVGSPSDSGNLATVLKLDIANVQNTTTMGTIVSAGPISGLNPNVLLTQNSANLITAVTAGTFSINGVSFTVTPSTDSIANILSRINTSTAGVVATYDNATGQIQITNQQTGPRGRFTRPVGRPWGDDAGWAAGLGDVAERGRRYNDVLQQFESSDECDPGHLDRFAQSHDDAVYHPSQSGLDAARQQHPGLRFRLQRGADGAQQRSGGSGRPAEQRYELAVVAERERAASARRSALRGPLDFDAARPVDQFRADDHSLERDVV